MKIQEFFRQYREVAVACSGGVDSAVLLSLAQRYAARVKAYYIDSPLQPAFEREDAVAVAAQCGVSLQIIEENTLSVPEVAENGPRRCYYCKRAILTRIQRQAAADGFSVLLDGTNASDDLNDRPGAKALEEAGVLSPLRLCGMTKADIRRIAKTERLPVASKPAYACLATRIPTGMRLTKERLAATETAENALSALGLSDFRVRMTELGAAKVQLRAADFPLFFEKRDEIYRVLSPLYTEVYLDLKERSPHE